MVARKNPRFPKRKKLPDWAKAIHELYQLLGCGTQEEFAARLGFKQGTVSTWLRGDETRRPSADTLVRMAGLAPEPDLAGRFLRLVNIPDDTIFSVARKLRTDRFKEAVPLVEKGEIVLVPRYRYTAQGREEAGPRVPLPAEFIPERDSTICIVVDEKPSRIVSSPRGLLLVDTSVEGAQNLALLWTNVVLVELELKEASNRRFPDGLYVGRLFLREPGGSVKDELFRLRRFAELDLLTGEVADYVPLGGWDHPSFEKFRVVWTFPKHEDGEEFIRIHRDELSRALKETKERAPIEYRLPKGVRILGQVIGRLTGHLK